MALQLLPKRRAFPNPTLVRLFSSAAESSGDGNDGSRDAFESFFRDVRSALNRSERQSQPEASSFQPLRSRWRSDSPPPPRGAAASGEIHKTLASFRNPSPAAPPPNINPSDGIRKRLSMFKNLKSAAPPRGPPETKTAIGGSAEIPLNVLQSLTEATGTSPRRIYGHQELGEKLRKLRPERRGKDGDWFSLEELSARLTKLSETEEKDSAMEKKDSGYSHLRGALVEADQPKLNTVSALDTMIPSDTPSYMELPPKEHLLETYNHPDNMAAAEKMKIELAKVRDEFKMSESDCGSTRVQVALLTTKIKYLSSVLHKKDKHSRKGLVEMVHKRKRLLKYLRRTDWESYCFVLNKLGLRDVTNYKS